jgi:hypothetical protein
MYVFNASFSSKRLIRLQRLLHRGAVGRAWRPRVHGFTQSPESFCRNRLHQKALPECQGFPPGNGPHVPCFGSCSSQSLSCQRNCSSRVNQQCRNHGHTLRNIERRTRSPMANKLSRSLGLHRSSFAPHASYVEGFGAWQCENRERDIIRTHACAKWRHKLL